MELCVLVLLLVIPGSLAQEDLDGKMFVFPKETNTAHVILRPAITNPLQRVTVCLNAYSELSRFYSLFSCATPGMPDAFTIFLEPVTSMYKVFINQAANELKTNSKTYDWRHTCVTWDSITGVVQLWVNGKLYPGGVSMKGSSIAAETSIVLGQDQDTFGGKFDAAESLVGEISDVHMWNYVLISGDIQKVISGDLHGNVINWKSLIYEIKGEVLVMPKVQHMDFKMFVFPKETSTAHVILRPAITDPLQKVSVCLNIYSELSRLYTLFSFATPGKPNDITVFFQPETSTYSVYIYQAVIVFNTSSGPLDWRHVCLTWDSITGFVQLLVNGKLYPRKISFRRSSITAETRIILGQEQSYFGGNPNVFRSLVGEISDVHVWDDTLTQEDIKKVISGDLPGNVINWKTLPYEIKEEVFVKSKNLHMENNVFVFPKETNTAHVILRPPMPKPLHKVSVCLRSYTDLSRHYTPFSIATPGKDNAFLISLQPPNICSVFINQQENVFKTDPESLDWRHICVTWDSFTGVVQLWVNGKLSPRRVAMKGSSIAAETSIVLGQEQDNFGGGFDAAQSLVGEISDVHMWDYVLISGDIQKVISGGLLGNVINWKSLLCEMKGEVLIQPKP